MNSNNQSNYNLTYTQIMLTKSLEYTKWTFSLVSKINTQILGLLSELKNNRDKAPPTCSHKASAVRSIATPTSRYSPEYLTYAHAHSDVKDTPITRLARTAITDKPMNPVTVEIM